MGWGGRGGIRKGGRGSGARILHNPSVTQIKGATLSLNSAVAEYGITKEDLAEVPCQWRSCHGNAYPLLQRSDVEAAVARSVPTTLRLLVPRRPRQTPRSSRQLVPPSRRPHPK